MLFIIDDQFDMLKIEIKKTSFKINDLCVKFHKEDDVLNFLVGGLEECLDSKLCFLAY